MKKILICLLCVFGLMDISLVYAEKQEWYDPSFDFTKVKKIAIIIDPSPRITSLQFHEIEDIFMEKMKSDFVDELSATQYQIDSSHAIARKIFREKGINLEQIGETDIKQADSIFYEYIQDNYDLLVVWNPIIYDVGTQYCEGYIYTVPSINTSTVRFPNGQTAMITSNGQTVQSVPGGNFPVVYVSVKVAALNPKNWDSVWMRMDDRARLNRTAFDNTKPKDIYKRILGNFIDDFKITLNEKKAARTKPSF